MSFEEVVKVSSDRVGALVGKNGKVKQEIEKACGVSLMIDSKTGEVTITGKGDIMQLQPFKAVDLVTAISRGFSPERAFRLLEEDCVFNVIDLTDYAGKSANALTRLKGRIIGLAGKSRKIMEELTGAYISVYGHTTALIGRVDEVRQAADAIGLLASGSPHKTVYNMLQRARTKAKMDRLKLWEEEPVG